jgi:hypothetical protein
VRYRWSGLLSSAGEVKASIASHRQTAANTIDAIAAARADSCVLIT